MKISVSLSFTSGTLTTSYDADCDISSSFWTVSYCINIRTSDGHDNDDDDEDIFSQHFELSGSLADAKNSCNFIQIDPDRLKTTVKLENLKPCSQYTFTMYTTHMVGDKRKEIKEETVITEMTRCQGR